MESAELERKIQQLAEKKARLGKQEKLLRLKEKKLKTRRSIEIGKLAEKAGIDQLDSPTLLGAFLEIKERSVVAEARDLWIERASKFKQPVEQDEAQGLIISFPSPISDEIKTRLKQLRFWNHEHRKEWYGYGRRDEIAKALEGADPKIEMAPV